MWKNGPSDVNFTKPYPYECEAIDSADVMTHDHHQTPMSGDISEKKKRVLVIRSNYLLSAGVECLLHEQQELEVVGIDIEYSNHLAQDVILTRPNVMVIDENTVITNLVSLVELFEKLPELRVIVVHLQNNLMSVFDKRHIPIQQLTDFYAAL